MEFVVNMEPWDEDSPVSHDSTNIKILDNNENEISSLNIDTLIYILDIDVPVGETYYVELERVFSLKDETFDLEELTYTAERIEVTNNEEAIGNMLNEHPVVIEQPYIMNTKSDFINNDGSVVLKSSKYRGSGDGHTHTHWVVRVDNKLRNVSINDSVNKTELVLDSEMFSNATTIEVSCTHCSNNIESAYGSKIFTIGNLNFNISSNLENVNLGNYTLIIDKVDNNSPMRLSNIRISHNNILLRKIDVTQDLDTNSIILNSSLIESGRYLTIELYGYTEDGTLGKKTFTLKPIEVSIEDNINKDYVYDNIIENVIVDELLPKGLVTDDVNDVIIVPKGDEFITMFLDNGILTERTVLNGIGHLGNVEDIYIKHNDDQTILIDCYDSNNNPTFLVFKYNSITNSHTLVHVNTRVEESKTVAVLNTIEQINNYEFIYCSYDTNSLKKYNILTNELSILKPYPEVVTNLNILKMSDNNLLVINNTNYKSYIYNIEEDKYQDGISINVESIVGKDTIKVNLINGDILLLPVNYGNTTEVGYFNIKEYELSTVNMEVHTDLSTILYKFGNSVVIANILEKDLINFDHDRLDITTYR